MTNLYDVAAYTDPYDNAIVNPDRNMQPVALSGDTSVTPPNIEASSNASLNDLYIRPNKQRKRQNVSKDDPHYDNVFGPVMAGGMGTGGMGAGRMGAGGIGAGRMGAGRMGAGRMGAGRMGAGGMGAGGIEAGGMGAGGMGAGRMGAGGIGAGGIGAGGIGAGGIGAGEMGAGALGVRLSVAASEDVTYTEIDHTGVDGGRSWVRSTGVIYAEIQPERNGNAPDGKGWEESQETPGDTDMTMVENDLYETQ